MKRTLCCIVAVSALAILFTRCNGEDTFPNGFAQDGCQTETSNSRQPVTLYTANIYVETSGSMFGFMPSKGQSATRFQDDMWDLITRISQKFPKNFGIYQVKAKNEPLTLYDKETFRNHLNSGKFQLQTSTDIPEMLDSVLAHTSPTSVSILISDLIFSPEDNSVARLDQIDTDIFDRFGKQKYASSIFHLHSNYQSRSISSDNSPYYVWVIGPEEGVRQVSQTIRQVFDGINEIGYGIKYPTPDYSILPGFSKVSNAIPLKCLKNNRYYGWIDFDTDEGNIIEFVIAANLSHLPYYAQDNGYLQRNLSPENRAFEVISVNSISLLSDNTDLELSKSIKATHTIKIKVKNLLGSQIIDVQIKDVQPKWHLSLDSPIDDKARKKTFGLSRMMNGLTSAYGDRDSLLKRPMKVLIAVK